MEMQDEEEEEEDEEPETPGTSKRNNKVRVSHFFSKEVASVFYDIFIWRNCVHWWCFFS